MEQGEDDRGVHSSASESRSESSPERSIEGEQDVRPSGSVERFIEGERDVTQSASVVEGQGIAISLTHLDARGHAQMVDVTTKLETSRRAVASGVVLLACETVALLRSGGVPKGDALGVARIAGIMAAKRASDLIPLCHPLPITKVRVDLTLLDQGVAIEAEVAVTGKTGVEMEALTAVSVAALTLYDMVKAVDKRAVITDIRLEAKSGGKSGDFAR